MVRGSVPAADSGMVKVKLVVLVTVVLLTATGCPWSKLKIAPGAIEDVGAATRLRVPSTITLDDGEVSTLARQASVPEEVIRDVAPNLDSQPRWKSSMTTMRDVYDSIPEEVRSGSTSILCDFIQGDITSQEDLDRALLEEFGPSTEPEAAQIVSTLYAYAADMGAALRGGDELAASVALTCFIAEQAA